MNKVVIIANCQGIGVKYFLKKSKIFKNSDIVHIRLDKITRGNKKLKKNDFELIKNCDLAIYQIISDPKYEKVNPLNLFSKYNPTCKQITFSYIYNNSFYPFKGPLELQESFLNKPCSIIFDNSKRITDLIDKDYDLNSIIKLFEENRIDFQYEKRWKNTIKILEEKEKKCDVKMADFIKKNFSKKRLFLLENHPTSFVFIELVNQILNILKLEKLNIKNYGLNDCKLPGGKLPLDKSSCIFFNYNFDIKQNNEDYSSDYYIKIIKNIYVFYNKKNI